MSAGLVAVDVCGAGWAGGAVLVRLSMSAGLVAVAEKLPTRKPPKKCRENDTFGTIWLSGELARAMPQKQKCPI